MRAWHRRSSALQCGTPIAPSTQSDVDCGARVRKQCEQGYKCSSSEDCGAQMSCVQYYGAVEGRYCNRITSLRYPFPAYRSSVSAGVVLAGMGKWNFVPLALRSGLATLLNVPVPAVRIITLDDVNLPYPGDPYTAGTRVSRGEDTMNMYVTGMNATFTVFSEQWEVLMLQERLTHLLDMRVNMTRGGSPCYAGNATLRHGTETCPMPLSQRTPRQHLDSSVDSNLPGTNLIGLLAQLGPTPTSVSLLSSSPPTLGELDASPSAFYRPHHLDFATELSYANTSDVAGGEFWYTGEWFPQPPAVIIRDRHGRHITDVTTDTQITARMDPAEFPPKRDRESGEVVALNDVRVAGPVTAMYSGGISTFARIYVTAPVNTSSVYFVLENNQYASEVPWLASQPLLLVDRPQEVVIIPPPEVLHPVLVIFLVGCVMAAALFAMLRCCHLRMWCRVPVPEKRNVGGAKVTPSVDDALEKSKAGQGPSYTPHEPGDSVESEHKSQVEVNVKALSPKFKNLALDVDSYSDLAARLPRAGAQSAALGVGTLLQGGAEDDGGGGSRGRVRDPAAVAPPEAVVQHRETLDSIAAASSVLERLQGAESAAALTSRGIPTGETPRPESAGSIALAEAYSAIGTAPPKRRVKRSGLLRLFSSGSRASEGDPHGEFDLSAPAEKAEGGPSMPPRLRPHSPDTGARRMLRRQSSTSSVLSAGGLSTDEESASPSVPSGVPRLTRQASTARGSMRVLPTVTE